MHLHVELPEQEGPFRLSFDPAQRISDERFLAFCQSNPDLRVERTPCGEIVIMPPSGYESSFRSLEVSAQLRSWARRDGRGVASDSSAAFLLPDGSILSPDAAWVSKAALSKLSRKQRREFVPLCPEFVVEVMSPSDKLKPAKEKMSQWIANGVQLAWLIDGDSETVYIYRSARPAKSRRSIQQLSGEGPVEGFILDLDAIWRGLK